MKAKKLESLPCVKEFSNYFVRKAKRVLGVKNSEFNSIHIDLIELESIEVWFFAETKVLARAQFTGRGQLKDKWDNRKEAK